MIEINLIPNQLRKKRGIDRTLLGGLNLPAEMVVGIGAGFIFLLLMVHLVLLYFNITTFIQYRNLQTQWDGLKPVRENVDSAANELKTVQNKLKSIEEIIGNAHVLWSQKLNILSDDLPRGVWLRKLSANEKMFSVEGSALSKQNEEMINVHTFTTSLKEDKEFMKNFSDLELGSISRRQIDKVDIADFVLTARLP